MLLFDKRKKILIYFLKFKNNLRKLIKFLITKITYVEHINHQKYLSASLTAFQVASKAKWLNELVNDKDVSLVYEKKEIISKEVGFERVMRYQTIKPKNIPDWKRIISRANMNGNNSLYIIKKPILEGEFPIVNFKDQYIVDSLHWAEIHKIDAQGSYKHYRLFLQSFLNKLYENQIKKDKKTKFNLDYAMLLFNRWDHYGHWIPEHFTKIRRVLNLKSIPFSKIKFIVKKNIPKWQIELFKSLSINSSQIIEWEENTFDIENLIISSYPEGNYTDLNWIKSTLINYYKIKNKKPKIKVYISREKFGKRKVINEKEVTSYLKSMGFKIIYPELLTLKQQVEIFSSSEILVGPHGSGFVNSIFSSDAKIIEFFGDRVALDFYCYNKSLGNEWYCLLCEDVDNNMKVDLAKLKNLLNSIIKQ